ncbi:hypothetical protein [Nocardia carnea]|nr:hypothetical protein [Nocardia carnea]
MVVVQQSDHVMHLIMDNYAAHKKAEARDWLAEATRVRAYFTPASAS